MNIESFTSMLQLSVVPVVMISGVGLLLLSVTNRLARTIDRSRILSRELADDESNAPNGAREQLTILVRRCELLRSSIFFGALSIFLSSTTVAALLVLLFVGWPIQEVVLFLVFSSVVTLSLSVLLFLLDVFLALKALHLDVAEHMTES